MIAAKHFDPVMGMDIHINMVPMPAPTPIPLPHIFAGMVFDKWDYLPVIGQNVCVNSKLLLAAQPMTECKFFPQFPMAGPFPKPIELVGEMLLGSVTVGTQSMSLAEMPSALLSIPGAILDDPGQLLSTPLTEWVKEKMGMDPHIPPDPPKSEGPPPPPPTSVYPLSRLGDMVLGCADVGAPAPTSGDKKGGIKGFMFPGGIVMAIPMGPPVLIGGGPAPAPLSALALRFIMKFGMPLLSRALSGLGHAAARALRKAMSKSKFFKNLAKSDNLWRAVHRTICFFLGHPVDIATGKVFTDSEDFNIPGPIPLIWERVWHSASTYNGTLGHKWSHSYDMALSPQYIEEEHVLRLRMSDGRAAYFPILEEEDTYFDRQNRLDIFKDEEGYCVQDDKKLYYRFHENMEGEWKLARIENDDKFNIQFEYDDFNHLQKITDSVGRVFSIDTDALGRITTIHAPHPDHSKKTFPIVQYRYDKAGDLVEVLDALEHSFRYQYDKHLLIQETNRNGLNFYFVYEGEGTEAKCVHTYGDDDLLNYKLTYEEGKTIAEKIVKTPGKATQSHFTTYYHNGALVTKEIDPMGNESHKEYNEFYDIITEIDALGNRTEHTYDERGNKNSTTFPDSTQIKLQYSQNDNITSITDQMGGKWQWAYDDQNRITEHIDCMENSTSYYYNNEGQLTAITNPARGKTLLGYDKWNNIEQITTPDNATGRWKYDKLGRLKAFIDPKGNITRWKYDLMSQVLQIDEPDGNRKKLTFDREGNVIKAKDKNHDVRFEYQGMWMLKARIENNTRVEFQYNSEEELVAVVNEHGSLYQFDLDANGDIVRESGFDGVKRQYTRDAIGQATSVLRASGIRSEYRYNKMGQITDVIHSNGEVKRFVYDKKGTLSQALNDVSIVNFERDALQRVVKEEQNGFTISSEYNELGLRKRITSSLGLDVDIERNLMGDVTGMMAQNNANVWDIRFKRDIMGLEIERIMPGGVKSRWERDNLGRPVKHEIVGGGGKKDRSRTYTWGVENRLKQFIDFGKDITQFDYDKFGNLALARYPNGTIQYRIPDKIGNLFRKNGRKGRKYDKAGQLLEAEGNHYKYDTEGNLIKKTTREGDIWEYEWNATGMLSKVIRPDKDTVTFTYDPFGRRLSKTYKEQTTRWIWSANVPIHEWKEAAGKSREMPELPQNEDVTNEYDDIIISEVWSGNTATEDYDDVIVIEEKKTQTVIAAPQTNTQINTEVPQPVKVTTWLFEPETFTPVAKLVNDKQYSIQTDHLGTPVSMYDETGERIWAADIDTYGTLHNLKGNKIDCPFRFPGQYEDVETGLYYNRYRYYDPSTGLYTQQDSIGLAGNNPNFYAYVHDSNTWVDPFGLSTRPNNGKYHIFHDHTVNPNHRYSSDAVQFNRANKEFINRMNTDQAFRRDMLGRYPELNNWMKNPNMSSSPAGLTWHHHEDTGRLTLVDRVDHSKNHGLYHPTGRGGRDIWGGGDDGRKGKLDGSTGCKK